MFVNNAYWTNFIFFKFVGILKFVKIREFQKFLKFIKFEFSSIVSSMMTDCSVAMDPHHWSSWCFCSGICIKHWCLWLCLRLWKMWCNPSLLSSRNLMLTELTSALQQNLSSTDCGRTDDRYVSVSGIDSVMLFWSLSFWIGQELKPQPLTCFKSTPILSRNFGSGTDASL